MIGQTIGHYKIIEKLGAGGMGEVYLAEHTKLDRKDALKFLPHYLTDDPDFRARLEHEAKAMAALKHPNIVTVYDLGEYEGRLFIAMEYVEGDSLEQVVKRGDVTLPRAVEIVRQVCEGLHEVHEAGIVHRDIKPSNILIDTKGRARILDFGLAKSRRATAQTKTGTTLGTLQYESPEQVLGEPVDARSDLFSLGAVLYELITGRTPFAGEFEEAIRYSIIHDEPEPLARYKSGIPDALQRLQVKLLTKDPSLRYQTAADLLADLRQLRTVSAPGESVGFSFDPTRAQSGVRRRKRFVVSMVLGMLLAVMVLVFKPWHIVVEPTREATAVENRLIIMYFDNLANPTDAKNLGEIAANLLIADLSETVGLQVVSSQRLFDLHRQLGYREPGTVDRESFSEVARRARARWMLTGSVVQEEPSLGLSAQLVDATTGNAIASQRVSGGDTDDIFSVIDMLAAEVRSDLAVPTGAVGGSDPDVSEVTTSSEEAYRHYLSGMRLLYQYNVEAAFEEFGQACGLDSNFAMAHFRLATGDFMRFRGNIYAGHLERAVRHAKHASTKERMYIEAFRLAQKGDYEEASEQLRLIADRYPEEKEALLFLGGVEFFLRASPSRALAAFREVLRLDPSYGLAHNYLGYAYSELGDGERALEEMDRYIALSPGEPNPYDSKGDIYALQGDLERAIAAYRTARRVEDSLHLESPSCVSCWDLGRMYLYAGEYGRAERAYRRLLTSEHIGLRYRGRSEMAFIPAYQGKFLGALAYLDQAIAADSLDYSRPVSTGKLRLQAMIELIRGRPDLALDKMDKCLSLVAPNQGEYQYLPWRIRCLAQLGRMSDAEKDLRSLGQQINQREPRQRWLQYLAQAWLMLEQQNPAGAVAVLDSARSLVTQAVWGSEVIGYELASAYLTARRVGEAISMYESILSSYSSDASEYMIYRPLAHYRLGIAYEESGSAARAVEEYHKFLTLWKDADEDLPQLHDARARLNKLKGKVG